MERPLSSAGKAVGTKSPPSCESPIRIALEAETGSLSDLVLLYKISCINPPLYRTAFYRRVFSDNA